MSKAARLKLSLAYASLAQLAEHGPRKRMVVGSIHAGGSSVMSFCFGRIWGSGAETSKAVTFSLG